jgi:tryptophanyl-tRNA synthetase
MHNTITPTPQAQICITIPLGSDQEAVMAFLAFLAQATNDATFAHFQEPNGYIDRHDVEFLTELQKKCTLAALDAKKVYPHSA